MSEPLETHRAERESRVTSGGFELPDLQRRYRVLAELGSGGMADVFLALQVGVENFSRLAVVKRMRANPGAPEETVRMFLNEARLVATLNHPHIVKVFDVGRIHNDVAMAMEYVDGESLHFLYQRAKRRGDHLPMGVVLKLVAEAAEALHYAHAATASDGSALQLIHRDIGLSNLLLSRSGYLKVIDFGVAKSATQSDVTSPGLVKGKLRYFAPEVLTRKDIDGRADLYALGLVLYELLTLEPAHPFARDATLAEVYERITTHVLPPVSGIREVPPALDALVWRATQVDRDARFRSGAEMADAIRLVAQPIGGLASTAEVESWFQEAHAIRLDERRQFEQRAVVRAGQVAPLSDDGLPRSVSGPRSSLRGERIGELLRPRSSVEAAAPPPANASRVPRWLLAGALLLLAVLTGTFAMRWGEPTANADVRAELIEHNLRVTSSPPRANVFVDGALRGHTGTRGLALWLEPEQEHEILIRLDGYSDYVALVTGERDLQRRIDAKLAVAPHDFGGREAAGLALEVFDPDALEPIPPSTPRLAEDGRRPRRSRTKSARREEPSEEESSEDDALVPIPSRDPMLRDTPEVPLPPPLPPVLDVAPERLPPVTMDSRALMARRIGGAAPGYPRHELERRVEGTVRARVVIDPDGEMKAFEILDGLPTFRRAVRQVLGGWKFEPHVVRGQRVETRGVIEIEFRLAEEE